jgi:tRNA(Ile)-lysidine synthase
MALERKLLGLVRRERLLSPGDRVIVAVSGGPDSVALLAALASLAPVLKLRLHAVHFNYGLRGNESDDDERFVEGLCARLGVGLTKEPIRLAAGAKRRARSVQERARVARYERLADLAERLGAARVALGHTADDHAETLCLWMMRGSGLGGLRGIPVLRDGLFVRPLLDLDRRQVADYLASRGLAARTDSSNATDRYARNRVRRHLVPFMKAENPSLLRTLRQQATLLHEDHRYLEESAREAYDRLRRESESGRVSLQRGGLAELPAALLRRVIRLAIRDARGDVHGASFRTAESIVRLLRGASVGRRVVGRRLTVIKRADDLIFLGGDRAGAKVEVDRMGIEQEPRRLSLLPPATVSWPSVSGAIQVHAEMASPRLPRQARRAGRLGVWLDAERFSPDLALRSWRPGDWFCPAGMDGRRQKLQDFFTNLKIPKAARATIPLLVAPEGILWVAGYRADDRFVATDGSRRVLHVCLSGEATGG